MVFLEWPTLLIFWALIFQALAGGTLIYVVVFEVLQREKSKVHVSGMAQLAFVIIGFSVLMCIEIFGENQLSFNLTLYGWP